MTAGKSEGPVPGALHGYEFGGPLGALAITVVLPLLCYAAIMLCNDRSGCPVPSLLHPRSLSLETLQRDVGWTGLAGLASVNATLCLLAYYILVLVLSVVLPGAEVEGVELRTGGRLTYKCNAFSVCVCILAMATVGTVIQGADFVLWTFIWDNLVQLLAASIGISVAMACFTYVRSFQVQAGNTAKRELAAGGQTGNLVYDWFFGRELNPSVTIPLLGAVDLKFFCEIRPGFIGWILLDLAFVAHQYRTFGFVTDSILIITVSQLVYVLDAQYLEPAMLSTIDIINDGFGFMLSFGDLVWLPFTYSLQARYLAMHPVQLGVRGTLGVIAVQLLGYYIFRASNNEKSRFRANPADPRVAHLTYLETKSGSKLLTSGWWGTARHINYLGDWIMSWAYVLPTGVAGFVVHGSGASAQVLPGPARGWGMVFTYFYMLYFAVLLIHREMRDEQKCVAKYGDDWRRYKKLVPWRILPGVY
ncbi:MAG: erg24, C-14 sterol reductase [Thelocarpon superellum]|nr:MAG: erg24, C-14 sterol reductase [Thelocarpon superellum]